VVIDKDHLIYVSSPYTHRDKGVEQVRFQHVEKFTARLLANRYHAYSPIVHCHELAVKFALPTDAKYWQKYNEAFLVRCSHVWVYKIEGWDVSKGVKFEIDFAEQNYIPVRYFEFEGDLDAAST
jgi:hypothetical protein